MNLPKLAEKLVETKFANKKPHLGEVGLEYQGASTYTFYSCLARKIGMNLLKLAKKLDD